MSQRTLVGSVLAARLRLEVVYPVDDHSADFALGSKADIPRAAERTAGISTRDLKADGLLAAKSFRIMRLLGRPIPTNGDGQWGRSNVDLVDTGPA